jgi:hypothetical protein
MDDCGSLATLHPSEMEYSMRSITSFAGKSSKVGVLRIFFSRRQKRVRNVG